MAQHADDCPWNSEADCDCGAHELEMCDGVLAFAHEAGWEYGCEMICQIKRRLAELVAHRARTNGGFHDDAPF